VKIYKILLIKCSARYYFLKLKREEILKVIFRGEEQEKTRLMMVKYYIIHLLRYVY